MTEKMFDNEVLCIVGNLELPVMCRDGKMRYVVLFHGSPIHNDFLNRVLTISLPENQSDEDRRKILLGLDFPEEVVDERERQRKEKVASLQGDNNE